MRLLSNAKAFFPGMQAHIICCGIKIGVIGELHPEVLGGEMNRPVAVVGVFRVGLNVSIGLEWF